MIDKYYHRNYYKNHKEKRMKSVRKWQDKNKNKTRIDVKKWKDKNPKKIMQYRKKNYLKNGEHVKELNKLAARKRREVVINFYGGNPPKCACCGESIYEFLTIDHINNDGAKHRKELGMKTRGGNINNWIIRNNFPKGFQILCYNCNCAKGFWGQCPHKK